jgi:hypothetical protein
MMKKLNPFLERIFNLQGINANIRNILHNKVRKEAHGYKDLYHIHKR